MLSKQRCTTLENFCRLAVDQQRARVIVPAYEASLGFWFGGGNMVADPEGNLYLVGRYRNQGDSRTGLASGSRGLELAIFRSTDQASSFEKIVSFRKQDLSRASTPVLSIEGSALVFTDQGVELYVSTEKDGVGYPSGFERFLKPGTGVWSIDRLSAPSIEGLTSAKVEPLLASDEPSTIHVKDPFLYQSQRGPVLFFCSHPFSWTCSNTGYVYLDAIREPQSVVHHFFPRGNVWDVAMSRGTCILDVPPLGDFLEQPTSLMFYDGGECVRNHVEHQQASQRPRGYSCEELGGAAYFSRDAWEQSVRLSRYEPMFISPHGSGCSRYVDVLSRPEGMYVTWQQAQEDGSQPLVVNFISREEIASVLSSNAPTN